jgi:mRNA-degrading endonuclease toxin of MazEF toxin-antitoxin module
LSVPGPGELYWAYFDSGQARPLIVVSRSGLNGGKYVVAVPLTSSDLERRWSLPNTVCFRAGEFQLPKDCVAQCEAIAIVEKASLDLAAGPFARLTHEAWRALVRAIGNVICADCEPE